MKFARGVILASSTLLSTALSGSVFAAGGYGMSPYGIGFGPGMGYGPGVGYGPGMGYGGPMMGYPQRPMPPKRPMPPQRPKMGMPYGPGHGKSMKPGAGYQAMPQGHGATEPAASAAATAPADAKDAADVSISGMRFNASTVTIKAGGTVTWTNSEGVPHTVTANDGSFGSSQLGAGDTFSHTFTEPGTYSYYCQLHPMMRATVVVVG